MRQSIPCNPADKVEKLKADHFDHEFYHETEMATLFEAAQGYPLYALIKVTAYYGLRRSAIDFEEKTNTINKDYRNHSRREVCASKHGET